MVMILLESALPYDPTIMYNGVVHHMHGSCLNIKVQILINQSLPCVVFETLPCILLLQYLFSEVLLTFPLSLVTMKTTFVHFLG